MKSYGHAVLASAMFVSGVAGFAFSQSLTCFRDAEKLTQDMPDLTRRYGKKYGEITQSEINLLRDDGKLNLGMSVANAIFAVGFATVSSKMRKIDAERQLAVSGEVAVANLG